MILSLLLTIWLIFAIGCGKRIIVVRGDDQVVELRQGEEAPYDGYLLTPAAFLDLYEAARWSLVEPAATDDGGE